MNIKYVSPEHFDLKISVPERIVSFHNVIDFFISVLYEVNNHRINYIDLEKSITLSTHSGIYIKTLVPFETEVKKIIKNDHELIVTKEYNPYARDNYNYNLSMFRNMREHKAMVRKMKNIGQISSENSEIVTNIVNDRFMPIRRPLSSFLGDVPAFLPRDTSSILAAIGISLYDNVEVQVLSQEEFGKLPVKVMGDIPDDFNEICVICQNDFEKDDEVVTLPCDHEYHKNCIKSWLTQNSCKCPTCRNVVDGTSISNIQVEHIIPYEF